MEKIFEYQFELRYPLNGGRSGFAVSAESLGQAQAFLENYFFEDGEDGVYFYIESVKKLDLDGNEMEFEKYE